MNLKSVITTLISNFLDLTDTPNSYSGQSGKVVKVKSTENQLEFGTLTGTEIINVPAGNITAINIQSAINELDTKKVLKVGDVMTGDLIGTDFVKNRSGIITRDGDGFIASVTKTGGRILTITRDANDYIASITDATRTWTFTRNGNNQITNWTVA